MPSNQNNVVMSSVRLSLCNQTQSKTKENKTGKKISIYLINNATGKQRWLTLTMKVEIQNYFGIAANRKVIIHPKHLMKEWKEIAKTHDISHCAIWTKCLKPHMIKMNFQIKLKLS